MEHADIAVIGGGQSGLAAAHALLRHRLRPVVSEASDRAAGLWHDEDFAGWYPCGGRPGPSPAQSATVCVLRFLLGPSDRRAAEAVRCRIDCAYALAMELDGSTAPMLP